MTFIPAVRGLDQLLRFRMMENFNGRRMSVGDFHSVGYPKVKENVDTKIKDIVLIDFRHVGGFKHFRWNKQWWRKTSWKGGTSEESYHELEFEPNQKVGVRLRDLSIESRKWIHKQTTSL